MFESVFKPRENSNLSNNPGFRKARWRPSRDLGSRFLQKRLEMCVNAQIRLEVLNPTGGVPDRIIR